MEISCPDCGKKFSSEESMEQHRKAKHTIPEKPKKKLNMKMAGIAAAAVLVVALFLLSGINFASNDSYSIQRDRGNVFGPDNSTITVTEYSDFECPFCGQAAP